MMHRLIVFKALFLLVYKKSNTQCGSFSDTKVAFY